MENNFISERDPSWFHMKMCYHSQILIITQKKIHRFLFNFYFSYKTFFFRDVQNFFINNFTQFQYLQPFVNSKMSSVQQPNDPLQPKIRPLPDPTPPKHPATPPLRSNPPKRTGQHNKYRQYCWNKGCFTSIPLKVLMITRY